MFDFLSETFPLERGYYFVSRWCARSTGIWPELERSWWMVFYFYYSLTEVGLGAVCELLYGFINLRNLLAALEAFCPGVTKAICVLKMSMLFAYHKEFANMIAFIWKILTTNLNTKKRKIVQKCASIGNTFSFLLLSTGGTTNTAFNLRPLLINLWRYYQELEPVHLLPFNAYLPEECSEYPYYPITYVILTISGFMTVFVFTAVDGFFLCTCSYLAAAFRVVQHDIREIFTELESCEHADEEQNRRIRAKLNDIVERHCTLRDLCANFSKLFSFVLFMHLISAALILCLSILDAMLNAQSIGALVYVVYSIAASVQYFLYCSGGSLVSESCVEVADTLYDIQWYKCDVVTRKAILMILREAQQMQTIQVPFFQVSLAAFNALATKTGSYVALLKTFL